MPEPSTKIARRDEDWRISLALNVLLVAVVAVMCLGALTFGTPHRIER